MTVKHDEALVESHVELDDANVVELEDTAADGAEAVPFDAPEAAGPTRPAGPVRRVLRALGRNWFALALAVALVASAGATAWIYVNQYRPDRQTDAEAAASAIKAASDGTVALLSYAPDTLDKDFSTAKTHLTGDFLNYYTQFTEQIVTPAAKKKSVKTSAAIVNSAVMELHPGSAVVLLFLNQTTTSAENPDGSFSTSSVKVGLTKVDGNWLIASFDPV